jgi:hypothetical protein
MNANWYALSIRQPWVDLILRKLKTIEVRDWEVSRRGPILLHASRTIDWQAIELFGYTNPWELPRGQVVGYARIVDAFAFNHESWLATASGHLVIRPLSFGNYGLVLDSVRRFRKGVACPGKLYFFPVPLGIQEKLKTELAELEVSAAVPQAEENR